MIRFTQRELDAILGEFLGKPYRRMATGPDAYDCYGLVQAFLARVGMEIPEIGKVDPKDSRPVYEQQQTDYIRLEHPRPWSLVTFSGRDLNAHIGVVLPSGNLFLHCPGRAAGKVIAEPLSRRPWRDTIDGYWWPRNYLETVLMLTPMTTKRAWQFVRCDGRSLGEIIEQDIVEGRDVLVQAFIDGQLVEVDDWAMIPSPMNQLVIRPVMGDGDQALMIGGMLAMAAFAPWAAGALNKGLALGLGKVGLGMLQAGVMMGGAVALNALVGPDEGRKSPSQHYTWDPVTTQQVGSFIPLVYGTFGVRGNIICSYATSEVTTKQNLYNKETQVSSAKDLYWLKIAYSDGPIEGVVDGSERLNDKSPQQYDDSANFTLEHFRGTDDQEASEVPDAFELPVNQLCYDTSVSPNEVTKTFTAVKCDRAAVVLRFPNGFTDYESDGDHKPTMVDITVRIRELGGSWHVLADGEVWGDSTKPVRLHRWFHETYDGGSPFTLVAGTTYEVGVTRNNSRHSDQGDDFYFDCIQCAFTTAQKHPGLAYTAIGAVASKYISGAIDYYAVVKGKLVRVYDDATETWSIEWSDNPAWVAYDILTRPVIKGNGDSVAYSVEYYRRLDPSYLDLDSFVNFADWCDEMVADENGGTEKRFVFNGVIDDEATAWEQAVKVCRSALAMPCFRGSKIRVVIDEPCVPTQMFNVSNLREGFSESWIDTSEVATVYDCEFYDEQSDYGAESWPVPLLGATNDVPASLDCFGHTKRSRVWRYASRHLRVNQYMKRTVEIPACLDAIYTDIGDIVYVQHPSLQRATGGRIVEVYADGVKLDKPVSMLEGDWALLIRTHDGTDEHLTLYEVDEVTGAEEGDNDIVTIVGTWEYTPNINDLWTFGEEVKVIDLYRVKGFERTGSGQVLIQAAQYTTDYYADDEEAPKIEAKVYSQTKGGLAPSLLPTTEQAIAAARREGNSVVDTILWEGLTFTGDAVDKVTWECTGAGIKYKGVWCPIEDDATGTTDKYVYFDPAAGDPRYLQHTNSLASLAGEEKYVFCVNIDGIAYFKPGILITADEVKLDGIEEGATVGAIWGVNIVNQPDMVFSTLFQELDPAGENTGVAVDGSYHTTTGFGLILEVKRDDGVHLGTCKVDSDGAQTINVRIQAWDSGATGSVLYDESFVLANGENTIDLNVDLDRGTYILYRNGTHGLKRIASGFDYTDYDWDTFQIVCGAITDGSTYAAAYYYFFELTVRNIELENGWFWVNADREFRSWNAAEEEWVLVEDPGVQMALDAAADAQATADGKIKTFVQASEPTAESTGDLWLDSDDGYKMYRWSGSAWVNVRDTGIASAISAAATAQSTADGKVTTFYADSEPTAEATGDLWIDTDDNNKLYRWSGSEWVDVQDGDVAEAVARAGFASAIASDGKVVSHYSAVPPFAAHWKMNDAAASTAVEDSSGNGHDLAASHNTEDMSVAGKVGTGLEFITASSRYAVVADHADLRFSNGGTWCAWIKWDGTKTDSGAYSPTLLHKSGLRLYLSSSNGTLTQTGGVVSNAGALVSGQWRHIALVLDPIAGTRTLYVDGVEDVASGKDGSMPDASTGSLVLGAYSTTQGFFGGVLDDVRLYSRPLTRGEILRIYNEGDGTESVVIPDVGDFWIKTDEDNKPYRWNGQEWVDAEYDVATWSKIVGVGKPEDGADVTKNHLGDICTVGAEPASPVEGELWLDTSTSPDTLKRWDGVDTWETLGTVHAAWSSVVDDGDKPEDGADVTSEHAIDITHVQATAPANPEAGWLWCDTSKTPNELLRYNGSIWVKVATVDGSWSLIVNDGGKPADNADVTADSPVDTFRETFEDPNDDVVTRWSMSAYTGRFAIVDEEGVAGGRILRCGDDADVDTVYGLWFKKIAYDPTKLYRLKVRVRRTAGTGPFYLGVYGYLNDGTTVNNPSGTSAHWVPAQAVNPGSDWTTYTGYFRGLSATGMTGSGTVDSPRTLKDGTVYFTFRFLANFGSVSGITDIDEIVLDVLPENADEIAESDTKKWAGETGADVTADHATSILFRQDTAPDNPQEGWTWWDTSGNPLLIKRYDGAEWVIVGVDIQNWLHDVDPTKLDGQHLYPQTVTTDKLSANCVTAAKILVESLSSICAYIGTLVGGSITGSEIIGGILRTATSGRYVQIDEEGIKFFMVATAGLYGTTGSGGSNLVYGTSGSGGSGAIYGNGVLARFYNMGSGIPFDIVSEQPAVGDMHLFPRSSDPTTGKPGDIALVNNKLRVCTSTTPTWQDL